MGDFFQPPPAVATEQAEAIEQARKAPPWTGRPQGAPPGQVLNELVLARSQHATLSIAYLDAYPEGFELEIEARASVVYRELGREGDRFGPDVFGRHWPMAGERRDRLPAQLLRVGVQFADGRTATNISGHDGPLDGPVVWALSGGGSGGGAESRFHQGYWVSPLPPSGPLTILCQWPALDIPLVRHELDSRVLHDAAGRARTLFPSGGVVVRDGREWRLGADADITWINDGTSAGTAVTCAIPPVFASYCTLRPPPDRAAEPEHEQALIELLSAHTPRQLWWLGYLDTGASDVVFPYAPRTTLYYGYGYVLVEAGPQQARNWRAAGFNCAMPDLIFPRDRAWLTSTMWDDAWTSIGGPTQLVDDLLSHPLLGPRARRVSLDDDVTQAP